MNSAINQGRPCAPGQSCQPNGEEQADDCLFAIEEAKEQVPDWLRDDGVDVNDEDSVRAHNQRVDEWNPQNRVIGGKSCGGQPYTGKVIPMMTQAEAQELNIAKYPVPQVPEDACHNDLPEDPHSKSEPDWEDCGKRSEYVKERNEVVTNRDGNRQKPEPHPNGEDFSGKLNPERLGRFAATNLPGLPSLPERPGIRDFKNLPIRSGPFGIESGKDYYEQVEVARRDAGIASETAREVRAEPQLPDEDKQAIIDNPPQDKALPDNAPKPSSWEKHFQGNGNSRDSTPLTPPKPHDASSSAENSNKIACLIPKLEELPADAKEKGAANLAAALASAAQTAQVVTSASNTAEAITSDDANPAVTDVPEEDLGKLGGKKFNRAEYVKDVCQGKTAYKMGEGALQAGMAGATIGALACASVPNPGKTICVVAAVGIGAAIGTASGAAEALTSAHCEEYFGTDKKDDDKKEGEE